LNTQKQIGLIIALFFVMTASCAAYTVIDLPIRAEDQAQWQYDEAVERGALLYANNCRTCHGIRGEGFVGPALNTAAFQNQDPLTLAQNKAMLMRTLSCGRAGTLMPAWLNTNGGSLNIRQIEHLVKLITTPAVEDEDGAMVSWAWEEAEHFAHNLNHHTALVVGGDTLTGIARSHDVGVPEIQALNPDVVDTFAFLPKGTKVRLPASGEVAERTYEVKTDRENLHRISESEFVGAMILADLNNIPYDINLDDHVFTIGGLEGLSEDGVGLFPGAELRLPAGSTYALRAGDTLDAIAALHNTTAGEILNLNRDLASANDPAAELEERFTLTLPEGAVYIVQDGDTAGLIEEQHHLPKDSLAEADLTPGARIVLPEDAVYVVQAEDTLALAAQLHGVDEAALAAANDLAPGTPIRPDVVFQLPDDPAYIVQGQLIPDIVATLGGVTEESLAEAQEPPVAVDHVYAVGSNLIMPEDAYGNAPPDAKNPGTACVQHAVNAATFEQIITGVSAGPPDVPEEFSEDVVIQATQSVPEFDWIVIGDGEEQAPNEGAVKIEPGTTVVFENVAGLHTITINGTTEGDDIGPAAETREFTFSEPGEFQITCEYHPAMIAWVFVEEAQ
jgi:LysM repeat protein/plastocyanin/mono/diheme cytochrome c family protein